MEAAVFRQGGGIVHGRRALKEEEERSSWCDDPAFGGRLVVVDGTRASFPGGCSSSVPPETAAAARNDGVGCHEAFLTATPAAAVGGGGVGRRKNRRRREGRLKNEEEAENQRMNHITVERNRRKQMNDYLAVLQSLMPPSYVARGDQASIVGGAINFVRELEQLLQSLEARKRIGRRHDAAAAPSSAARSSSATGSCGGGRRRHEEGVVAGEAAPADDVVEVVRIVERHANLKVVSRRRRPKQLLRMVVGLQNLRLTPLHLNLTSVAQMAFYSFSLKVEDDCQLISMDDIASAVQQMVGNIQEEDEYCDTTM